MPTFDHAANRANELREAARGLAHASRDLDDPRAIYPVIGSLSLALNSMAQVLHQLGAAHDHAPSTGMPSAVGRDSRATSAQVSWELHRAAEMLTQVGATVDRAHQLEAAVTYDVHLPVTPPPTRHESGLSL